MRRIGRLALLAAVPIMSSCASPEMSLGPVRAPSWLQRTDPSPPALRLHQSVSLAGARIRVCRRIENISSRPAVIYDVEPEGENHGEFTVAFYDRHGDWIMPRRDGRRYEHPMFSPPIPASADDVEIYTLLPPGGHADNCSSYDLPEGHATFQVVAYYSPSVAEDMVPLRLREGNQLMQSRSGPYSTYTCIVDVPRRSIRCSDPIPAAALSARSR